MTRVRKAHRQVSGKAYVMHSSLGRCRGCTFCDEFFDRELAPLHAQLMPGVAVDRVLDGDDQFVIVPSIGPLSVGHVLVVPRLHAVSALSLSEDAALAYESWVWFAADRVARQSGQKLVAFEHGSDPTKRAGHAGACIEHAHIHVIPRVEHFVTSVLSEFDGPWRESDDLQSLRAAACDRPYLLLGEERSSGFQWHLLPDPPHVPSQYFRRAYAEAAGQSGEWNWRVEPGRAAFVRTMQTWPHAAPRKRDATGDAKQTGP